MISVSSASVIVSNSFIFHTSHAVNICSVSNYSRADIQNLHI